MSGFQSPQILTDLYRDLRDRRLLPLALVLLVGMAVVPIALSSSSETPAPPTTSPPTPASVKSNAPAEEVVVSDPGVRDYQRRLEGDAPTDPFVQEFTAPLSSPLDTGSTSAGSSAGSVDGSTSAGATTAPTTPGATTGGGTSQPQTQSKYYFYRVKVRAGQVGEELKVYDSVGSLTTLPSKQVPAVSFLGVTTNGSSQPKTAVFLVSSAVSSIDGEGSCTFAGASCQLLSLKPGEHEDLVWTDGLVYRIDLVKFDLIVRNNPPSVAGQGSSGSGGDSPGRRFSF